MKLDAKILVPPLVAALVLVLTLQLTMSALKISGAWKGKPRGAQPRPPDPYGRLDVLLSRSTIDPPPDGLRDPFAYGGPRPTVATARPVAPRILVPPPPPRPVLTSIIWDNDPRATIRYNERDFSVRVNSLFADFRVKTITSTQVVLERGGEPLVLTLRSKGD